MGKARKVNKFVKLELLLREMTINKIVTTNFNRFERKLKICEEKERKIAKVYFKVEHCKAEFPQNGYKILICCHFMRNKSSLLKRIQRFFDKLSNLSDVKRRQTVQNSVTKMSSFSRSLFFFTHTKSIDFLRCFALFFSPLAAPREIK